MPITSQSLVRSTAALLMTGLAALVVIVVAAFWLGVRSQTYFDDVIAARDARTAAVALRQSLELAESSQRGYLLTGNERYLKDYGPAHDLIPAQYESAAKLLSTYPQANQELARLKMAIDQKLSEMDQTIALKKSGRDIDAFALVNSDQGKALMEEAQRFFTAVIGIANDRMAASVADQQRSAGWLRSVSIIAALVIVLVVGGSILTVLRYTRELAKAQGEVNGLNQDLEKRVAERTADLARANDEIQRFAYIVTHDLRAPLVNIMGFTSELEASVGSIQALIEKSTDSGDPVLEEAKLAAMEDLPEAIGFIRASTHKMDGLINAILKLSREGRRVLRPERVDLAEVIGIAVAAVQHQVNDAEGAIDLDVNVPSMWTDRLSLEQIFGNLLDNAVKYRSKERPLHIRVNAKQGSGGRIAIEIADNGRGIAEQDGERVFELFRRSGAQDQPGEGIGLAYVRAVVRNLGGDIAMTSSLDEGTTFRITVPRYLGTIGSMAA